MVNKLSIPFHRLPLLVQVQAIQTMGPKDWINLAMTSNRNEKTVKLARIKTDIPCIQFYQYACIRMSSLKLYLFFGSSSVKTENWDMMTKEDMKTWLNEPSSSVIENAAKLCQKLQNLFVFERFPDIMFHTNNPERATIGELLSNPTLRNWVTLSITGGMISSGDLKMIMDKSLYRVFECEVDQMPLDFKHENAFKFYNQKYHDARWVQIEDLYGLKNSYNVTLFKNNFTREQIKSFVNYWVNSEVDMFLWLKIQIKYFINFGELVDGFLGLRCNKLNNYQFLMLSKTTSTSRKKTMLAMSYTWNSLILTEWGDDENYEFYDNEDYNKPFRNCREILTKLQEKKELEDLQKVGNARKKRKYNPLSTANRPTLLPPTPKCEFESTFPVRRLPLLVQVKVIRQTDPNDWINLAMTSKRIERVVKLARIKTENPCVEICQNPRIKFSSLKFYLLCYEPLQWANTWKMMTKEDLKPWLNEPNSSMIESAAKLYEKAQNILVFSNRPKISFCTNIEGKATIRELLSNPVMKNWRELLVYGKKISSEDLKMIMDTAALDRHFECRVGEMPLDFKHKNAFKFASQDYRDARWVRIEDLYGLRHSINVTLLRNNFSQEQIKSFVNHWVNSKADMFWWMHIETKEETNIESLMDGYFGLRWSFKDYHLFIMLSKTTSSSRKKTMLTISCHRNDLVLTAWAENENYQPIGNVEGLNKPFRNLREILTKLHKKKDLEDLQKVGSLEEKIELEGKIEDIVAELKQLEVEFRNGEAWLISI